MEVLIDWLNLYICEEEVNEFNEKIGKNEYINEWNQICENNCFIFFSILKTTIFPTNSKLKMKIDSIISLIKEENSMKENEINEIEIEIEKMTQIFK